MKYICDICGWEYDEEAGFPQEVLHRVHLGKMFRKTLYAHFAV